MSHQLHNERIPSNGSDETFINMDEDIDMDEVDDEIVPLNTKPRRFRNPFRPQKHYFPSEDEDADSFDQDDEEKDDDEEGDGGFEDDDDLVIPGSDLGEESGAEGEVKVVKELEEDGEDGEEEEEEIEVEIEEESFDEYQTSSHIPQEALQVPKNELEQEQSDDGDNDDDYDDDDDDDDGDDDDDDVPISARVPRARSTVLLKQEPLPRTKREPTLPQVKQEGLPVTNGRDDGYDSTDDVSIAELGRRMRDVAKRKWTSLPSSRGPRSGGVGSRAKQKQSRRVKSPSGSDRTGESVKRRVKKEKKEEDVPSGKFEKLGQRRETPPDNDSSRLFYESMYREKVKKGKRSVLAENWLLRHGLLEDRVAKRILAEVGKKKKGV